MQQWEPPFPPWLQHHAFPRNGGRWVQPGRCVLLLLAVAGGCRAEARCGVTVLVLPSWAPERWLIGEDPRAGHFGRVWVILAPVLLSGVHNSSPFNTGDRREPCVMYLMAFSKAFSLLLHIVAQFKCHVVDRCFHLCEDKAQGGAEPIAKEATPHLSRHRAANPAPDRGSLVRGQGSLRPTPPQGASQEQMWRPFCVKTSFY